MTHQGSSPETSKVQVRNSLEFPLLLTVSQGHLSNKDRKVQKLAQKKEKLEKFLTPSPPPVTVENPVEEVVTDLGAMRI